MNYYLNVNGSIVGPMTAQQVFAYTVDANTMVSVDGSTWQPLYTQPELMQILQAGQASQAVNSEVSSKKTLCCIMALFFGTLGVHYFIMGKTGGGLLTILLSLVTCGAWGILVLIQGIMILCMTDAEFKRKYLDSTSMMPLF